ncbi:MAG: YbhN family protein [Thermoleophilia bacterium]
MRRLKRWMGPAIVIVVIAVFAVVLPRIADYGTVWRILTDVSPGWAAAIAASVAVNILCFPPSWMAGMPGLGYGRAMVLTQSSTAASIALPGGDVVGMGTQFAMLRGWGFGSDRAGLAVLVTGIWNQLVRVAFPVIAVGALAVVGDVTPQLRLAAALGAVAFAVILAGFIGLLARDDLAQRIGDLAARVAMWFMRLIRRPRRLVWGDDAVRFRDGCADLVRRRWPHLTIATVVGHLTVFGVLMVTLRAVGVGADDAGLVECFAAWSLIRLLTAVPITPGGLGVVELGLTGGLVAVGADQEAAVAGVLLFRALTVLPVIIIGAVCFLLWRRTASGARPAVDEGTVP